MILEGDIIKILESGNQYATADIYKALGGKKSKDIRQQLDNLYKQGTLERTKISNSYFWKLRSESEHNFETKKSDISNLDKDIYHQLLQQLRDEIRFLRGTVSDLLKLKQSKVQQKSDHATPSTNLLFPTETPRIPTFPTETPHITTAASSQPPPPLPSHSIIQPVASNPSFETPKRTTSPKPSTSFSIPLNNRYEHLQHGITVSDITSQPSQPAHSPIPSQTAQVARTFQPGDNHPPQRRNIGPHVNRRPENDTQATNLAAQRDINMHNVMAGERTVGLLGDSNFNRIQVPEMNKYLTKANAVKYSYSGATSIHLGHYCDVLLNENPHSVIIHGGTNDIWGGKKRNASSQQIAQDIVNIGIKCRERGATSIYISSILTTRIQASNRIGREVNKILRLLCVDKNFFYIDNDFITESDLEDQVHMTWSGRCKLVNNYIDILNR